MDKIYCLVDPQTLEPRYIGYTAKPLKKRLQAHLRDSLNNNHTHKQHWIRSLLFKGYSPIIRGIKYLPKNTQPDWRYWEIHYISHYRDGGYNLVNSTLGGDGVTMTPEIRSKIGNAVRGIIPGRETREKMRKAKLGKLGILCPNSKSVIAYNDTQEFTFASAQEAERELRKMGYKVSSKNIGQCLTGQRYRGGKYTRTQVSGFKFKRPDEKA